MGGNLSQFSTMGAILVLWLLKCNLMATFKSRCVCYPVNLHFKQNHEAELLKGSSVGNGDKMICYTPLLNGNISDCYTAKSLVSRKPTCYPTAIHSANIHGSQLCQALGWRLRMSLQERDYARLLWAHGGEILNSAWGRGVSHVKKVGGDYI